MPPDLNSLPPSSPSRSTMTSSDPARTAPLSPSPPAAHTPPHSLAAAAAMNAGIQTEERRPSSGSMRRDVERARRRSSIRMNLNLNDPTLPAPGELQQSPSSTRLPWPRSPHHERAPSLGELHQELEYEQEGQVNRLLTMIRQQQAQIVALQSSPQHASAVDDGTPTFEHSLPLPQAAQPTASQPPANAAQPRSRSPLGPAHYGSPSRHSSAADRSRGSSHTGSPALRPMSRGLSGSHEANEWLPGPTNGHSRDESAFYQAETQMLTRENQMLKLRIRELERQLSTQDLTSAITHSPILASSLHTSPSISRHDTPANNANATSPRGSN